MDKFLYFLDEKLGPIGAKIGAQRHLQAIRDGMVLSIPLLIAGSIFLVICNLPITGYEQFMEHTFGKGWKAICAAPAHATFWIFSIVAAGGIAYRLAESYKVDPLSAAFISIACFFTVTPQDAGGWGVSFADLGPGGMFVGIIMAIISTEIYRKIIQKDIVIKMPPGVPPSVSKSFTALIPGMICITTAFLINLLAALTPYKNIHALIAQIIQAPVTSIGTSLLGTVIIIFFIHLLWVLGLHGAIIIGGVMEPIWLQLSEKNLLAYNAHHPLPHIVTKQFFDVCIYIGGSGTTLALVVLMIFAAKSKQNRSLGKVTIGSGIFNINEPVIFGAPIVMNPLLCIPFIVTPVVLTITSYLAMSTGLVAKPLGVIIPWATPPIIGGWLATGSISASILQIVNFFISMAIYYPFFKLWDKKRYEEEQSMEGVGNN